VGYLKKRRRMMVALSGQRLQARGVKALFRKI
jgi:hypothetical protein